MRYMLFAGRRPSAPPAAFFADDFTGNMGAWTQSYNSGTVDIACVSGAARLTKGASYTRTCAMVTAPFAALDQRITISGMLNDGSYGDYYIKSRSSVNNSAFGGTYYMLGYYPYANSGEVFVGRVIAGVATTLGETWYLGTIASLQFNVVTTGESVSIEVKADGETVLTYSDTSENRIVAGDYIGFALGSESPATYIEIGEFAAQEV